MEQEARSFFEECPDGLFLVLDDAESLHRGKFRTELRLLCDLFRRKGWRAELGCPAETRWNGRQLLFDGQPVRFIVNRSTDFFTADGGAELRAISCVSNWYPSRTAYGGWLLGSGALRRPLDIYRSFSLRPTWGDGGDIPNHKVSSDICINSSSETGRQPRSRRVVCPSETVGRNGPRNAATFPRRQLDDQCLAHLPSISP